MTPSVPVDDGRRANGPDRLALAREIWRLALREMELQMTRPTFDTWLRSSEAVDLIIEEDSKGRLIVGVVNAYALDWLNYRLMPVVQRAVQRMAGGPVVVEFVVRGPASIEEEPAEETEGLGDEVLLEAVREEHTTLQQGVALSWVDFYIKLKVAFRKRALRELKGARLSVFLCLALHVDRDGVASPGIETIMQETGYSRSIVCNALEDLVRLGLVSKRAAYRGADEYLVNGYAWFGQTPAPALWELPGK